jgi:non-ribosomal peptide synthetase component F
MRRAKFINGMLVNRESIYFNKNINIP